MTKEQAKKKLALAASRQGLKVQMKPGKVKDAVRILNASGKVVAEGTLALDASKGYVNSDVQKTINQINTKLGKKRSMNSSRRRKMNSSIAGVPFRTLKAWADSETDEDYEKLTEFYDTWMATQPVVDPDNFYVEDFIDTIYSCDTEKEFKDAIAELNDMNSSRRINSSRRRKMNAGCHGRKRLNSADDVESDEYIQDDAEFVEDVASIVTDEQGNEIVVEEMLVVQNPETNEISLFVPTEEDETVPENVEVIGEVVTADDETTLDSSRKRVKMKASKRTRR